MSANTFTCPGCDTLLDPILWAPGPDNNYVCPGCGRFALTGVVVMSVADGEPVVVCPFAPRWLRLPGSPALPPPPSTDDLPALLSGPELARRLRERGYERATDDAVLTFLRRHREKYPDSYISVDSDDRRRDAAQYLYRTADVWPALVEHFR